MRMFKNCRQWLFHSACTLKVNKLEPSNLQGRQKKRAQFTHFLSLLWVSQSNWDWKDLAPGRSPHTRTTSHPSGKSYFCSVASIAIIQHDYFLSLGDRCMLLATVNNPIRSKQSDLLEQKVLRTDYNNILPPTPIFFCPYYFLQIP